MIEYEEMSQLRMAMSTMADLRSTEVETHSGCIALVGEFELDSDEVIGVGLLVLIRFIPGQSGKVLAVLKLLFLLDLQLFKMDIIVPLFLYLFTSSINTTYILP